MPSRQGTPANNGHGWSSKVDGFFWPEATTLLGEPRFSAAAPRKTKFEFAGLHCGAKYLTLRKII
jgi:hypothetical protein